LPLCVPANSLRTIYDPAAVAQVRNAGGAGSSSNNRRGGGGGGRGGGPRIMGLDTLNKADHSECGWGQTQAPHSSNCCSGWDELLLSSKVHVALSITDTSLGLGNTDRKQVAGRVPNC
jgi:hypothetical protein